MWKRRIYESTAAKKACRSLLLLVLVYLALGLAFGVILPPFENLDEMEHFEVIRYVAERGRLPVHDAPETATYHLRQEASQPPLYYLLSAGLARLTGLRTDEAPTFWRLNPRVACGPDAPHIYDNRAVLYHDPHHEAFPWTGALLTLHGLRLVSTLLQTVTVVGTFSLGRRIFPHRPMVPVLAAAVVAFNPQFLLVASGVNNDNLVTPLATVVLLLALRTWQEARLTAPRGLLLGLLVGAAGLAKLSGWLTLIPCAVLFLALWLRRDGTRLRLTLTASLIPLTASAVSGWWFWRNWQLYGDPTALRPMLAVVGSRGWSSPLPGLLEAGLMFRSFWGQLPCAFYPERFYLFYSLFAGISLIGMAWLWRQLARRERHLLLALAGWFLLVFGSWLRWNMMTPAPGGRLLFPAFPAVALLLSRGWTGISRRPSIARGLVMLLGGAAWWTVAFLLPAFFAPPPRYTEATAPRPAHPLAAAFEGDVHLLGYDVALDERAQQFEVTLHWRADARPSEDYLLALQWVSPIPGDTTLRWSYDSWPGRGNYPTSAWRASEIIVDRYRFDLPPADFPTQAWDLHLALYREQSGERLPIRLDGTPAGTHLILTRLRLSGRPPSCPPAAELQSVVSLGDAVRLTHAAVEPAGDTTRVTLCWAAERPLLADYTVFVHLLDGSGALVATGDGPPAGGAFPTSLWQSRDVIRDIHVLPLHTDTDSRIVVGLYHPADGSRLPAQQDGTALADNTIIIWP